MGYIILVHHLKAEMRKKSFSILALSEKKPWERGRVNHDV